ncbi:MAG: pilus assembly protein [Clostridiales bacterium]|nr:pilus assembly protein [Clostridiales bacterium]
MGKSGARFLWKGAEGSLTVEAALVLPVIFLLIALSIRWAWVLHDEVEGTVREAPDRQGSGIGFLYGGPPARRIRDADLLIDLGHTIKERLPTWFPTAKD